MRRRSCIYVLVSLIFHFKVTSILAGYYSNRYSNNKYTDYGSLAIENCKYSVVTVTYITIICNSPYTFYYGNGANRNSPVCDYGDKAALSITIKVLDDLQEKDTEMYFTLAAYDDAGNMLASTTPENLCRDYIGQDCTKAGIYTFEKRIRFDTPSGNQTKFYPVVQIAFSTKSDSGYNLGAINMACFESDQNQPAYVSWSEESRRSVHHNFGVEYGMLIATCCALIIISAVIVRHSKDNPGFDHFPLYIRESSKETNLLDL